MMVIVLQPDAAERFMECKMAYQLLIDPSKRKQYDRQHQVRNRLAQEFQAQSPAILVYVGLHTPSTAVSCLASGWI